LAAIEQSSNRHTRPSHRQALEAFSYLTETGEKIRKDEISEKLSSPSARRQIPNWPGYFDARANSAGDLASRVVGTVIALVFT